jgi:anti-anti-sigma regulatory factor
VEAVVLDLESVPSLDVSAARMLGAVSEDLLRAGVEVRLTRVVGQVRDILEAALPDPPAIYPTITAALAGRRSR